MNDVLAEIFRKIGSKENTREVRCSFLIWRQTVTKIDRQTSETDCWIETDKCTFRWAEEMDRLRNGQTDGQAYKQIRREGGMGGWIDGGREGFIYYYYYYYYYLFIYYFLDRWEGGRMDRFIYLLIYLFIYGWMGVWVEVWIAGSIVRLKEKLTDLQRDKEVAEI